MGPTGISVHRFLGFFVNSIFITILFMPLIINSVFLIKHFSVDIFTITTTAISVICLLTGLCLMIITSVGFECEYSEFDQHAENESNLTHPSSTPK